MSQQEAEEMSVRSQKGLGADMGGRQTSIQSSGVVGRKSIVKTVSLDAQELRGMKVLVRLNPRHPCRATIGTGQHVDRPLLGKGSQWPSP